MYRKLSGRQVFYKKIDTTYDFYPRQEAKTALDGLDIILCQFENSGSNCYPVVALGLFLYGR